jgi:CheY-like chemotaxis protein
MDGVEFIRCLRADPVTAVIPILAASGDTHLAGAADEVLKKPYDSRRLVEIVDTLLEKGRTGQ